MVSELLFLIGGGVYCRYLLGVRLSHSVFFIKRQAVKSNVSKSLYQHL